MSSLPPVLIIKTYTQQLAEVQAAITACLLNQRYTIGNYTYERANLRELQQMQEYLMPKAQGEMTNRRGIRVMRAVKVD